MSALVRPASLFVLLTAGAIVALAVFTAFLTTPSPALRRPCRRTRYSMQPGSPSTSSFT